MQTSLRASESKTDLEKEDYDTTIRPAFDETAPSVVAKRGRWGKLLAKLEGGGVESRGLERVQEHERVKSSGFGQLLFWFSVNSAFSSLGTGWLAAEYYTLDFKTTMAIVFPMCALGCLTSAWVATLGPKYGLRTMALSRFAGGFYGCFVFSILNILTQLAYTVTVALQAAQALHAINSNLSLIVGIVIVTVIVFVISIYGYQVLHHYERYAWIVSYIILVIIIGLGAKGGYQVDLHTATMDTGDNLIGDVLSFAGIMFSVSSGWTTIAADYNVTLPSDTPYWRTFWLTFFGTYIPIVATVSVSAGFQTISNPDYITALQDNSIGGIVGAILEPAGGFGKFLLVILALSCVSANIPNTYSGSLSMQSLHPIFMKVPRIFYVCLFTAAGAVASIVGREHFGEIASNFAALLSYWTAFFTVVLMLEFIWFRRVGGPLGPINPDDFCDFNKVAPGYACIASVLVAIGGIVPSMAETYYTGPIALAIAKPYGGDLGFEFSAVFTFISYLAFRTLEIKIFKR